ncbi:hypothetical protein AB0B45_41610 [Nonomuraea sp. NPDC049152]|uniref:nucleotidyltransferase domain-containing protein n=1 Tax=Nonomuraea sp. NPDC049152 TaxID=3154350 RepID=UPI0033C01983
MTEPEMTADDAQELLSLIDSLGIRVWLDAGWAVDTCLGSQTRPHADLDIVVQEHDVPAVTAALRDRGYRPSIWARS